MATIVRETRDPWWANLAVNVLGGLWNDYQQREQNKKINALQGEIASAISGLAGVQDNGGGLMTNAGSNIGASLGGNAWENAFHQSDNPLADYDADMAEIAPTAQASTQATGQAAPVQAITRRQPTSQDILKAFAGLMSSKRFSGVNPKAAQDLLTPYLTLNEQARAEQRRKELAEAYMGAGDDASKLNELYRGVIEGYVPQSILTSGQGRYQYDNPYQQAYTQNTGGTTRYGSFNPRTGTYTEAGHCKNELTPYQVATIAQNEATRAEQRRQFKETIEYNREGREIEREKWRAEHEENTRPKFTSVVTGNDGRLYQVDQYGNRRLFDPNSVGLSDREKALVTFNTTRINTLTSECNKLLTARANLLKEQSGGTAEAYKDGEEPANPQLKAIDDRLEEIRNEIRGYEDEIGGLLRSKAGTQGSQAQGRGQEYLPPVGQGAPASPNTSGTSSYTFTGRTTNGGQYSDIINKHAENYNVDPDLIAAIIQQESGGKRNARSKAGAAGLMQLMPKTASGLGVTDVYDPDQNIMGGTKYISQLLKKYGGDVRKALWAYNAGPGRVAQNHMPEETKKYIPQVLARYEKLKGQRSTATQTNSSALPPVEAKYTDDTPQFSTQDGEILTKSRVNGLVWKAENGQLKGIKNREDLYREFERRGIKPVSSDVSGLQSGDVRPLSPDMTMILGSGDIVATSPDVTPALTYAEAVNHATSADIQQGLASLNGELASGDNYYQYPFGDMLDRNPLANPMAGVIPIPNASVDENPYAKIIPIPNASVDENPYANMILLGNSSPWDYAYRQRFPLYSLVGR